MRFLDIVVSSKKRRIKNAYLFLFPDYAYDLGSGNKLLAVLATSLTYTLLLLVTVRAYRLLG